MSGQGPKMSAQGRRASLICSVLLGALLISCGGPSEPAVPPTAPPLRAAQEPSTAPEPEGGDGQATDPGQERARSQGDARSSGRRGGAPPGVGHELPNLGSDLAQKQQWDESIDAACDEAGLEPRCLRLDLKVYKEDQQGKTPIPNPGPNYRDDNEYSDCLVTNMDPLSRKDGGPEKVPTGSIITVEIACIPVESDETGG